MIKLVAGMAAMFVVFPAYAFYFLDRPSDCAPSVNRALSAAGIPASDAEETTYVLEKSGDTEGVIIGVLAWTRLASCTSGYFVSRMDVDCSVLETYTFGACRVKGVREG